MIDHTGIGVANVAVSAAFYDAALGALGLRRAVQMPEGSGQHTAFVANSPAEVDAFYTAALSAGGRDNGAPGVRKNQSTPNYYAAFVLDPDGNNIEAVFRGG